MNFECQKCPYSRAPRTELTENQKGTSKQGSCSVPFASPKLDKNPAKPPARVFEAFQKGYIPEPNVQKRNYANVVLKKTTLKKILPKLSNTNTDQKQPSQSGASVEPTIKVNSFAQQPRHSDLTANSPQKTTQFNNVLLLNAPQDVQAPTSVPDQSQVFLGQQNSLVQIPQQSQLTFDQQNPAVVGQQNSMILTQTPSPSPMGYFVTNNNNGQQFWVPSSQFGQILTSPSWNSA